MRSVFLLLLLAGCTKTAAPVAPPQSACHSERFEGSGFILCDAGTGKIEIRTGHRSFASLQAALGGRASGVAFAMMQGVPSV